MYDLATIRAMNEERCKKAKVEGKEPYVIEDNAEIEKFSTFPFPNIGDFRPKGWKLVKELFVDSTGFGSVGESALTVTQLKKQLEVGKGYAITEEGQFQVYIGEFEKVA